MNVTETALREGQEEHSASRERSWLALSLLVLAGFALAAAVVVWVTSGSSDDEFTHVYELDGSFDDAKGGPPLVATGGAFGPDGFVFEPGDGLTADIDLGDTYTIEFRVRVEASGHALKLFDFTDRATDGGLYVFDESDLLFWFSEGCDGRVDEVQGCPAGYARHPMAAGRDQLAPGSWATVRFARDGDTNTLSAEIDGIVQTWAVAYPPFAPQADAAVQQVDHADDFLSEATQVDDAPLHVLFDDRTTNSRDREWRARLPQDRHPLARGGTPGRRGGRSAVVT